MNLDFPRFHEATRYTVQYFGIGRIKEYMFKFAGKPNYSYLDGWEELIYELHQRMEGEINQVIHTNTKNAQVYFFEMVLRPWLTDYRMTEGLVSSIVYEINKYNNNTYSEFLEKVEQAVIKFQDTHDYKTRAHKETYERERPFLFGLGLIGDAYNTSRKITVINYKYYCIEEKLELIDEEFLPEYIQLAQRLANSYMGILTRYLNLWDKGQFVSNAEIVLEKQKLLIEPAAPALPQPTTKEKGLKLKTSLTAGQILYLFKTLKGIGTFTSTTSIIDLCRFIAENISTKNREELSADNLAKKWTDIPINDIAYWYDKFPNMSNQAIKDNPLKLKYKEFGNK